MPLAGTGSALKATMKATIKSALDAKFGTDHGFGTSHEDLADAMSSIADDIVNHITANALVNATGTTIVAGGSSAGTWPTTATGTVA